MADSNTAVNGSTHTIALDDGRMLAPGELAKKVDLESPSNAAHVEAGVLIPQSDPRPKRATKSTNKES